jgi:hypothetical protein
MTSHKTQSQTFDAWLDELGVDGTALSDSDNAALELAHEALQPTVSVMAAIVARHRAGIEADLANAAKG